MLPVELSPFHRKDLTLAGFLLHNRWPENLREWAQVLALAVRMAAVPGVVRTSEVFATADEEVPTPTGLEPPARTVVGVVGDAGPAVGEDAPEPGSIHSPLALMVLHPPVGAVTEQTSGSDLASGCLFLPGIPELGLGHRATWVEADAAGNIGRLLAQQDVEPSSDPDVAVLSTLMAA